jgi:hypothetical protein
MARTVSFSPATKTIPVSATTVAVWTPAEIDSAGVVMFHLVLQQAGAGTFDLSTISAVRVKANGQTVVDVSLAQLQSYQERWSPKGASDASTGRVLTIPLHRLGASGGNDDEDRCQFMPGATATVEIVFVTGATVNGVAFLGWTKTTIEPEFWVNLISQPMNIAGAQNNARVPVGAQGIVEGLGIVTANLRQVRAVLSGIEVMNVAGGSYNGLANLGDMLQASQSLYDAPDDASNVTSFQWLQLNQGLQANPATSWLEVTSSAGMAATDSIAILSIVPVAGA